MDVLGLVSRQTVYSSVLATAPRTEVVNMHVSCIPVLSLEQNVQHLLQHVTLCIATVFLAGSSFPLITSNPPFATCSLQNCRSPTSGPPPAHSLPPPTHAGLVNGAPLTNGIGTPSNVPASLPTVLPTQYYPDHCQASVITTNGLKHGMYNGSSSPNSVESICSYIRPLTWIPPGTATGQCKPHLASLITVDANPATPCQCQTSPIATAQTAASTATEPSQWSGSSEHVGYGWQVSSEETGSTEDSYYEGSPTNMSL